jgi:uncharacterized protein YjlB
MTTPPGAAAAFAAIMSSQTSTASAESCRARNWGVMEEVRPKVHRLFVKDDGTFPNNEDHPLFLFRDHFHGTRAEGSRMLAENGWTSPWVWGIYPFHHYHSNTWEALVCVAGRADVQLGGPSGPTAAVEKGDIVLIPPGVAHRQVQADGSFALLGSYPVETPDFDTVKGKPTERQRRNIAECFVPQRDPITKTKLSDLY